MRPQMAASPSALERLAVRPREPPATSLRYWRPNSAPIFSPALSMTMVWMGMPAAAAREGTSDGWVCDVPGSVPSLMRTMDAAISGRGFRPGVSSTMRMTAS